MPESTIIAVLGAESTGKSLLTAHELKLQLFRSRSGQRLVIVHTSISAADKTTGDSCAVEVTPA